LIVPPEKKWEMPTAGLIVWKIDANQVRVVNYVTKVVSGQMLLYV